MKTINYEIWVQENATSPRQTELSGKLLLSQTNSRACQQLLTGTNSTPGDLKAVAEQVDKIFFWKKLMGPSTSKTHLRTPKGTICLIVHLKKWTSITNLQQFFFDLWQRSSPSNRICLYKFLNIIVFGFHNNFARKIRPFYQQEHEDSERTNDFCEVTYS